MVAAIERKERLMDARFANLLCLLANLHRDGKRKPTPYTPADFMPGGKPAATSQTMTPEQMAAMVAPISNDKRS